MLLQLYDGCDISEHRAVLAGLEELNRRRLSDLADPGVWKELALPPELSRFLAA